MQNKSFQPKSRFFYLVFILMIAQPLSNILKYDTAAYYLKMLNISISSEPFSQNIPSFAIHDLIMVSEFKDGTTQLDNYYEYIRRTSGESLKNRSPWLIPLGINKRQRFLVYKLCIYPIQKNKWSKDHLKKVTLTYKDPTTSRFFYAREVICDF